MSDDEDGGLFGNMLEIVLICPSSIEELNSTQDHEFLIVDRPKVTQAIIEDLAVDIHLEGSRCSVIHGYEGSGKKSALYYVLRKEQKKKRFQNVYWVDCSSEETIRNAVEEIFSCSIDSEETMAERMAAFATLWNDSFSRLLVFANVRELSILKRFTFVPKRIRLFILTSDWRSVGTKIEIGNMCFPFRICASLGCFSLDESISLFDLYFYQTPHMFSFVDSIHRRLFGHPKALKDYAQFAREKLLWDKENEQKFVEDQVLELEELTRLDSEARDILYLLALCGQETLSWVILERVLHVTQRQSDLISSLASCGMVSIFESGIQVSLVGSQLSRVSSVSFTNPTSLKALRDCLISLWSFDFWDQRNWAENEDLYGHIIALTMNLLEFDDKELISLPLLQVIESISEFLFICQGNVAYTREILYCLQEIVIKPFLLLRIFTRLAMVELVSKNTKFAVQYLDKTLDLLPLEEVPESSQTLVLLTDVMYLISHLRHKTEAVDKIQLNILKALKSSKLDEVKLRLFHYFNLLLEKSNWNEETLQGAITVADQFFQRFGPHFVCSRLYHTCASVSQSLELPVSRTSQLLKLSMQSIKNPEIQTHHFLWVLSNIKVLIISESSSWIQVFETIQRSICTCFSANDRVVFDTYLDLLKITSTDISRNYDLSKSLWTTAQQSALDLRQTSPLDLITLHSLLSRIQFHEVQLEIKSDYDFVSFLDFLRNHEDTKFSGEEAENMVKCCIGIAGDLRNIGALESSMECLEIVTRMCPGHCYPAKRTLVDILLEAKQIDQARRLHEEVLAFVSTAFSEKSPQYIEAVIKKSRIMRDLGSRSDALEMARKAVSIAETTFSTRHPLVLEAKYLALSLC